MAEMEFLKENILNTTTMIGVASNTATVEFLFDRNTKLGYSTDGYDSTTAAVIEITFNETTPVSHILLQNHNLKNFSVYYDTQTASNLLQAFTTNSETSLYIAFSTVQAANIQVVMNNTIAGSVEKAIGELIISERLLTFERNPNAASYTPRIDRSQIRHVLPDGGVKLFNIKDKFKANIGLEFIGTSFYNSLLSVFETADPLYFVPFPTATSWDGRAYGVVWSGDFNFKYAENTKNNYSGNIIIEEISST